MYNLKKHIESVHKGRRQRDHKCTECKKAFSTSGNLKIHVESVHEGRRNHKCTECEKVFSTAGNLKAHILRSHGGSSVHIELTQTQVCPLKPNFEPTRTPSKSPNFEPVWSEMGQTQAQVCKNQISNPSEPRFVY